MTTERLVLTRPASEDVDTYFRIYGDPQTNLYNPFGPVANVALAESHIKKIIAHWDTYGFGLWKISLSGNPGNIIGFGGLSHKMYGTTDRINLGYRFAPNAWGKGYATELCLAAIRYGFEALSLEEIFAVVRPYNLASIRVLEKSGLQLAGQLDDVPGEVESLVYNIKTISYPVQ